MVYIFFTLTAYRKIIINSNIKIFETGIELLHSTLLLGYWFEYLILDKLRIKLDSKIAFFDLRGCFKRKLNNFECDSEVKSEKFLWMTI